MTLVQYAKASEGRSLPSRFANTRLISVPACLRLTIRLGLPCIRTS